MPASSQITNYHITIFHISFYVMSKHSIKLLLSISDSSGFTIYISFSLKNLANLSLMKNDNEKQVQVKKSSQLIDCKFAFQFRPDLESEKQAIIFAELYCHFVSYDQRDNDCSFTISIKSYHENVFRNVCV